MQPLYTENKSSVKISRGPLDRMMLGLFLFIMTLLLEFCLSITMLSSDNKMIFVFLMILTLIIFLAIYFRKEEEYKNTFVSITEDKILIEKMEKEVEIKLHNLKEVTLNGKSKGITVNDLVMTFVLKEGEPVKFSCLGDNTYLFLNMLNKRGISIVEEGHKYSPRLVLLDLLSIDDVSSLILDADEFFNEISQTYGNVIQKYELIKENDYTCFCCMQLLDGNLIILICARRYFNVFSFDYKDYVINEISSRI